ncbi:unnamed protein product [Paramecium pentaurelia]|uniref:Uncharacterized protein n=1 Tax=Paramecium pentaurelia TaxID=43138 RepID=A0A8S1YPU2_9CILI|nr:unnamed protein product [Paramecium pentaurelia]
MSDLYHLILLLLLKIQKESIKTKEDLSHLMTLFLKLGQITAAFDKLWEEIISESEQKQSEIQKEYSIKQYYCISSQFNEQKLITQNKHQYVTSFLENINNNSPFRQDLDERMKIYYIFERKLLSQVQFRAIFNTKEAMKQRFSIQIQKIE